MLSGQVAMPATVCGVATAPIDMPSTMKKVRARFCGRPSGRPASAATAEKTIAPAIQPAGNLARSNRNPPAAAMSSVSVVRRSVCGTEAGMGGVGSEATAGRRRGCGPRSMPCGMDQVKRRPWARRNADPCLCGAGGSRRVESERATGFAQSPGILRARHRAPGCVPRRRWTMPAGRGDVSGRRGRKNAVGPR